jgi:FtsH-binding integral membrane protein
MSDFDRNYAAVRGVSADRAIAIDAGLRAYMIRVYNYMAAAVGVTGLASWLTYQAAGGDAMRRAGGQLVGATAFGQFVFSTPGMILLIVATLGMVFYLSARIYSLQPATAQMLLMVYAALMGVMLSSVLVTYTGTSVARVFFITAASFGALSLYGYTTQRDLSGMGSFLIMGLFGLILASLVNIFLQSTGMQFVISAVGVLVFAGLTAWDTQQIKETYDSMDDGTVVGRKAIMGALRLYLDFINLFSFLLNFLGDRR